ncbi:MAG TPA: HNH endonuclease [Candidatus Hydrogenedentes bacterium]|nr:MAG: CRISPR-associated endonuclease Cas9 [Candidatus Hydrogenedentes bacterium ADurb.Bin170]HNZ47290.1 HNH endonuclease [Candidatus Hydrogenedentota bacterium]HOD95285.1 HNH endonuclease [Candidatus Hydrogenedentota bacterium]HOH41795.1 HNH endonuclease [Candidatus Hydrogenedentota bacterium]HOM47153.1 HNH endonuclease [Candidatus Hydrogenedentota bacterium]
MQNAYVLVLNKSWVAIQVTSARRALRLLVQGRACVVHPTDYMLYDMPSWLELSMHADGIPPDRYVYTTAQRIRLPEVVVLNVFNGFHVQEVRLSRRNLFARDKDTCQYCGRTGNRSCMTIDHVIPKSRGGEDSWSNLVVACPACNLKKRDRTPDEARMPLLKKPVAPRWLPRFTRPLLREELISWQRFVDLAYWGSDYYFS